LTFDLAVFGSQSITPATLRRKLLMLPGELVRTANVPTVRLPPTVVERHLVEQVLARIDRVNL
jgi:hypothetical protein